MEKENKYSKLDSSMVTGINLNKEEVERTLEETLSNGMTLKDVPQVSDIIRYAMDKEFYDFSNGKTITDYQIELIRKEKELKQ